MEMSSRFAEMIELDMKDADSDPDELVFLGNDSESCDPGQPCVQNADACLPIETQGVSLAVLSAMPSYTITRRKAELKSLKTVSRKEGVCRIRNMPLSVDEKRCLRREMHLDAEDPSASTAFQCTCHQFALRMGKLRMHLSNLFSVKPWRGTLKQVGARFGTVVLSYFLFLRTLLLYNVIMALLVGIFVVLPQAILGPDQPQPQTQNFTGLELLTGEGYFSNSLMFYGYYTNSSLRLAIVSNCTEPINLGYSIPLAYILIIIISFFVTCVMLVYSVSKSLGKSLLSEGGLTTCVFCSWDFKVTKKSSILLKQANISTQLKELISDSVAQRRKREGIVCQWLKGGLVWTVCLGSTGICVLGIYMYIKYKKRLHLEENVIGLPILVSAVNRLLPGLFRTVGSVEYYRSPSSRAYVAISRNLLLKTSILTMLFFHWMTESEIGFRRNNRQCWETYAGQELYRFMVADLIMTLLSTILGEFFWSQCVLGRKRRQTWPAFDIAQNVLDLIYGQTLAWAGVLFSPLLPAIQILKLLVLFYTKKASLLRNYRPSHQLWRTNQMNTILTTLLCFPAFTGALVFVAYGIWIEKPDHTCGPFRSLPTMFSLEDQWKDLETSHASLAWLSVVYSTLRKPLYLNIISTFLMMVIYGYRQKTDGQKKLIAFLKMQIRNEGEDKHFLISQLREQDNHK